LLQTLTIIKRTGKLPTGHASTHNTFQLYENENSFAGRETKLPSQLKKSDFLKNKGQGNLFFFFFFFFSGTAAKTGGRQTLSPDGKRTQQSCLHSASFREHTSRDRMEACSKIPASS
jgi:hypothetical protein